MLEFAAPLPRRLLKTQPQHHEQIAKLLVPGLWFKRFLNQFDACYVNPSIETSCNWKSLVERSLYDELLKEADYRDKVRITCHPAAVDCMPPSVQGCAFSWPQGLGV